MLKKISFLLIFSLFISCNFHIEKRRYFKGYYVEVSKSKHSIKQKEENTQIIVSDIISNRKINSDPTSNNSTSLLSSNSKNNSAYTLSTNSNDNQQTSNQNHSKPEASKSVKNTTKKNVFKSSLKHNKKRKRSWDDFYLFGLSGFIGLSIFGFLKKFKLITLKISNWAAKNKNKSQLLIGFIQTAFAILGVAIGKSFHDLGYDFSYWLSYIFAAAAFSGVIVLIRQKVSSKKDFIKAYFRKKMAHLLIALSSLMLMTVIGNNLGNNNPTNSPAGYVMEKIHTKALERQKTKTDNAKSSTINLKKKTRSENAGLIGLYVFLAVLMGIILMALTCAVWCWAILSGEIGIVVIAVVATLFMILLAIYVISSMRRSIDNNKAANSDTPN